ncbi:MAG: DUF4867 family protein [Eubacteriales bacterium]
MKIYSVHDPEFSPYGKIIQGYDTEELIKALSNTPIPSTVDYVPSEKKLESLAIAEEFSQHYFGGMPIQLGWCNGQNTKLNCLEYHRDSELNFGITDFILLLAKQDEIIDYTLDTGVVKAFLCPKHTLIDVYATTLHYAPCSAKVNDSFQVLVVLPKGTNTEKPEITAKNFEDRCLFGKNKWLLAHPESNEAENGAVAALTGENIDVASLFH